MTKLETIWLDGLATVHYVVDAHVQQHSKREIFDNLVQLYPTCNVIVSYADGTMLTNKARKAE